MNNVVGGQLSRVSIPTDEPFYRRNSTPWKGNKDDEMVGFDPNMRWDHYAGDLEFSQCQDVTLADR